LPAVNRRRLAHRWRAEGWMAWRRVSRIRRISGRTVATRLVSAGWVVRRRRAHQVEPPSRSPTLSLARMAPYCRAPGHFSTCRGPARSVSAMAELKSRLRADLTDAMKAKDKLRTGTLRMLLAAIQTEEVSGKEARELSDDDVLKVLGKEARKRSEAAEIYTQNGRGELAANEHAEARVIDEYLPTPLTEAEVADVVDTAIAQVAEELGERPGTKQMGQVMKAATALAAGKADGSRLSKAVKDRL
jgi:uncharacterized protein YqeY